MYATQIQRTPKSLYNFMMPDPLKGRLKIIADEYGMTMSHLVRSFVQSGVEEIEQRHRAATKGGWSVGSPKQPVTDRGEPLAIFANLPETDYENL